MLLGGVGLITTAFITQSGNSQTLHTPNLTAAFGWTYLVAGTLLAAVIATLSAIMHQALIGRMTFALFRLYATLTTAGIGSIFGWSLGWWMMTEVVTGYTWLVVWLIAMLLLVVGFGTTAYRAARTLRGTQPERFNWVTAAEFQGN